MTKIVLYTAFTSGYDELKSPPDIWRSGSDCVAFTNDPHPTPGWEIRPIHQAFADPCRNAKIHKILPHIYFPEANYSVWMDASIEARLDFNIAEMVEFYLQKNDLAVFKHRLRRCIYREAQVCIEAGKDRPDVIRKQVNKYRSEGYPAKNGLGECCVLFRRHTDQIKKFNELWYEEIVAHSRRDQLSFNYVAWKLGLTYTLLPGTFWVNSYFRVRPHKTHPGN